MAISSSDVLTCGPCGHQGQRICAGAMGRLPPFAWLLSVMRLLVNIYMPQGCDGVQVVALSMNPLCRHDINRCN